MMFADMGADVIRIDRAGDVPGDPSGAMNVLNRVDDPSPWI
jgi:crotonobetainyl-CoA:carnitine CoA-transferase CaiB-like acyl-CoA transferase